MCSSASLVSLQLAYVSRGFGVLSRESLALLRSQLCVAKNSSNRWRAHGHGLHYQLLFGLGTQEIGGQGGQLPLQILVSQSTLSQPQGANCAPHITTFPPSFKQLPTSLRSLRYFPCHSNLRCQILLEDFCGGGATIEIFHQAFHY